jgi:hypothetical protein
MKKEYLYIILLVAVLIPASLSALDNDGIDLSLRLYDKRIYYPETQIQVLIEITNNTNGTYRFKAAQDRRFNIDFQVRTLTNEPVRHSEQFITAVERNQQVYYRDIDLEPGERYSFVEPLKAYIALDKPGAYVAQALYSPDLKVAGKELRSNLISFTVRPSAGSAGVRASIDEATGEILRKEPLPPDETVEYLIKARQKGEWNKFLLYLDEQSLMLQNPDTRRRFERSSEAERLQMVDEFRNALQARETPDEILLIPVSYEIVETRYTPERGSVDVIERFRNPDFVEVKQFTYNLERRDGIWMIISYDVRNLGTE